jgi:hypothetical protein
MRSNRKDAKSQSSIFDAENDGITEGSTSSLVVQDYAEEATMDR